MMTEKSPEELARIRERDRIALNKRRAKKREEKRNSVGHVAHWNMALPSHKITARRMHGPIGNKTKAELREILAQAVRNTCTQ